MTQENLDAEPHVGPQMPEFERIEGEHPHARYKRLVAFRRANARCLQCEKEGQQNQIISVFGVNYLPAFGWFVCKNHPKKHLVEIPYPPIDYKPAWVKYCRGLVCPRCREPIIELKQDAMQDNVTKVIVKRLDPYLRKVHFVDTESFALLSVGQGEKALYFARIEHVCMHKGES